MRRSLAAAWRRLRHPRAVEGPTAPEVAAPVLDAADLDLLVIAARAARHGPRDGRGALADDRPSVGAPAGPAVTDPGAETPNGPRDAPVWVRRLDQRIPVMPTIGNVPIDNGEPDRGPRREVRTRRWR